MICQVTDVLFMLKHDGKSESVIRLFLPLRETLLVGVLEDGKVVLVVRDVGATPHPALLRQLCLGGRIHQRLHPIVELTV